MLKQKKCLIVQVSLLALATPALAAAQDTTEVIVTVTREPLPVSRIGQSVDVLSEKDIQTYQSLFIADLLTHTTDISLTRNGGPGESASASLRGAGADHTLYILDGIALNDPSQVGGGTNLGLLTADDTSRI
ncbi:MAG: TonB-dependent receptor, partial [Asticcacaulis sp.]